MVVLINNLFDECLLHIFEYLDPLSWVAISRVCKRWRQITLKMFERISSIKLSDPKLCYNDHPELHKRLVFAPKHKIKTLLPYVGPYVKTVKLGNCDLPAIYLNGRYGYLMMDGYLQHEDFVSLLSQKCQNIENMQIGEVFAKLTNSTEQLLRSNKNLKKLILPGCEFPFSNNEFESIQELIWRVTYKTKFKLVLPKLERLTLFIPAPLHLVEPRVRMFLQRVRNVKSLNVIICTNFMPHVYVKLLWAIGTFTQLEKLQILYNGLFSETQDHDSSVIKLIENCRNLRVLKIDGIKFGTVDVSNFLTLPNLEELCISKVRFFRSESLRGNQIDTIRFEKLTRLDITFDQSRICDYSGLCDAIARMPALKTLIVYGLPEEQTFEVTCKVIVSRMFDSDVIVFLDKYSTFKPFRVSTKENQLRSEPLRMFILDQEKNYGSRVYKFVCSLKNCSVEFCDQNVGVWFLRKWFFDYLYCFSGCSCFRENDISPVDEFEVNEEDGENDEEQVREEVEEEVEGEVENH